MERGISACLHILKNVNGLKKHADKLYVVGYGPQVKYFESIMPILSRTEKKLVLMAFHFHSGGCICGNPEIKERDYTISSLTSGLDSENSRLVVEAMAIYLGVDISCVRCMEQLWG
jgi:hypothetical protein